MTHDELLAKIEDCYEFAGMNGATSGVFPALRAVVELHKPFNVGTTKEQCSHCMDFDHLPGGSAEMVAYPCSTIQAIEKELNYGIR